MKYYVNYTLWDKREEVGRGERDEKGVYDASDPVECINAILYEIRGEKTAWELAYVNEVRPMETEIEKRDS